MATGWNLAPLIEGYRWLRENPQHFSMRYFIGKITRDKITGDSEFMPMSSTPIPPEPDTILCLGGAILLAEALKKGETIVEVFKEEGSELDRIVSIIKAYSPEQFGSTSQLRGLLYDLFMGEAFFKNYDDNLDTLSFELSFEQLWLGIQNVCDEIGYISEWTPE